MESKGKVVCPQSNTDDPDLRPLSVIGQGRRGSIWEPRVHLIRAFPLIGCQSAAKATVFPGEQ